MNSTMPAVGTTMQVATDPGALHYFAKGSTVRVARDNAEPGRWEAHRWLCWGRHHQTGARIQQWLRAEDLQAVTR